jgi:hypothetical protein
MPWRGASVPGPGAASGAVAEDLKEIRCVCARTLLWFRPGGVEFACRQCKRKVVVPWDQLRGPEALMEFIAAWRQAQQTRRPRR